MKIKMKYKRSRILMVLKVNSIDKMFLGDRTTRLYKSSRPSNIR